jgi:rare lipoprotein A
MWKSALIAAFGLLLLVPSGRAQSLCEDQSIPPPSGVPATDGQPDSTDKFQLRLLRYALLSANHRLTGLASYYSRSLDGTLTANGETYRSKRMSAAHLTLPLGCWVEVKSRATGKKIRLRVNDRGPYVQKFVIDLSQAAAHAIGVDVAEDRSVAIRIIALPGELPLPDEILDGPTGAVSEESKAEP